MGERQPNWTGEERKMLRDRYEEHKNELEAKFSPSITNNNKVELWQEISDSVSSLGVAKRSVAQCKKKYANMVTTAKTIHNNYKMERSKTGGGIPPRSPPAEITDLISQNKDRPSFSGIGGFEFTESDEDEQQPNKENYTMA